MTDPAPTPPPAAVQPPGQTSLAPTRKVWSSGLGGASALIVIWALNQYGHIQMPPEVASAATLIISSLVGYIVPEAAS